MTENKVRCVYPRLQLAYLLQFAIWGAGRSAGGYLQREDERSHIAYLFMAIRWGPIIGPMFIGDCGPVFCGAEGSWVAACDQRAALGLRVICAQAEAGGRRRGTVPSRR